VDQELVVKRQDFSHVNLLKELRFHPKDWHNFLRMNDIYLPYFIINGFSIDSGKKHHSAASYSSSRETFFSFSAAAQRGPWPPHS
jgi:hypothetical protein